MHRIFITLIFLGITLIVLSGSVAQAQMRVGTNLAEVSPESTTPVFVDAFRMAAPWKSRSVGGNEEDSSQEVKLQLNWPLEAPFSGTDGKQHIAHTQIPVYATGSYTLMVRGKGKISVKVATGARNEFNLSGGQTEIPVQINSINEGKGSPTKVFLEILQSPNSNERVSDIHLYPPNLDRSATFHPDFTASLESFDVLRFTDWGRTNSGAHDGTNTLDITQKDTPIQTSAKGVAIELMAELAKVTGKDIWYSVPHAAQKNYIRSIAQRFRGTTSQLNGIREGGLKEGLKLYIEYSNETWNTNYPQHNYVKTPSGNVDAYTATRSQYIWGLFLQEFTVEFGTNAKDWLVFVLSSQASDPSVTTARANALDPKPALQPDVVAIAPYFGQGYAANSMPTVDQVLEDAQSDIGGVHAQIKNHQAAAGDIPLVAYAGGQDIVALDDNNALVERLQQANRDPRMYNLYLDYLDALSSAGITLFNHYNYCEQWDADGSWGSLEYLNQPLSEAHKHRALLNWPEDKSAGEPTEDTQPPSEFTLSATSITSNSAKLEWTSATDNVGVINYTLYQNGAPVGTVGGNIQKYPITGLAPETNYTFTAEASDAAGNTRESKALVVTTLAVSNNDDTEPPTAPVLRVTNQTATSVSLEWTSSTDNEQVAFYYLYQGTELIATIEPNITNYTAEALTSGTYIYAIKATDQANNASEASNIVVVTISPNSPAIDRESPGAFQITLAEATTDSLTITWTTPTDNRGVTQYIIYQNGVALGTLENGFNAYTVKSLNPDSTYIITVVAYDAAGNSSEATFTAVMPDLLPPKQPEAKILAIQPQKLFSPNNDGQNDTWEIIVNPEYSLSEVQIYDRYGQKVFDVKENYQEQPWDGMWQGKPLATGAYYFIITYSDTESLLTTTGSVALIR